MSYTKLTNEEERNLIGKIIEGQPKWSQMQCNEESALDTALGTAVHLTTTTESLDKRFLRYVQRVGRIA